MWNFHNTHSTCKWSFFRSFLYLHDCTFDIIFLSQIISVSTSYLPKDIIILNLCRGRMSVFSQCRFIANQKKEEDRISEALEI